MSSQIKIFSGSASRYLAEKIADFFGTPLGKVELLHFSDGEMQVYYEESIRGCDVYIIQSTFSPSDTLMELLLMIDAARRASVNEVVVVMPYFGYARQDRKSKPRVSIGAKLVANLLTAAGAQRIVTMDLHAGQIQGFFDIPLDHLDASAVFVPYLKGLNLPNLCIASPDIGGSARARRYAQFIQADLIIVDKFRERPNEVASMQVIGDARNKHMVLVDDLVDTAGTICRAADLLMEKGALSVRAVTTHPIFSGQAYERIEASMLEEMVVTDTIPLKKQVSKVKVLSIAPVFAKAFRKIHNHESISSLFI
ncbi:MAG: ribose-phosphate pyrophosphokinase [Bacteroidetes bacterium]|nr:MAG: ribose-phosphate pyrophosphokinase [Bacteroidota bacterium]